MLGHFTPDPCAENFQLKPGPVEWTERSMPTRHTSDTGIQICKVVLCGRSFSRRRRMSRGREPFLMNGSRLAGKDQLTSLVSPKMYWFFRTRGGGWGAGAAATPATSRMAPEVPGGEP